MYTTYYGFREKPFSLSPDPRFLYLSESHREVLGHLLYGIEQGEGFMTITGEVGTGKTTLCRTLLRRLGDDTEVAFLFNPTLTPLELLKAVNAEFELSVFGDSRPELVEELNNFLLDQSAAGRRVLLIVDEAQNLSTDTLEQLRLLTNLETERSKLLQIVLLGQPELEKKLEARDLRQLRQRISVWWHLGPLDAAETRAYVRHRLRVAGALDRPIFSDAALRAVHRLSGGVPRVVNLVCDRALLAGYAEQQAQITPRQIRRVAAELRPSRRRSWRRAWIGAGAAAVAAALGVGWAVQRVAEAAPPEVAAPPQTPVAEVTSAPPARPAPPLRLTAPRREPLVPEEPSELAVLESVLSLRSPDQARAGALEAVFAAWRLPPSGATELDFADLRRRLASRRLEMIPLDPDMGALRSAATPSLVTLRDARGVPRMALLRRLGPDHADLQGLVDGTSLRVTWVDLVDHLEEAYALWRDFEALPDSITRGDEGPAVRWLQRSLADLGFYAEPVHGRFDTRTEEAVFRFQRERGLSGDGRVGPYTMMRLYEAHPRYATPTLLAEVVDLARAS